MTAPQRLGDAIRDWLTAKRDALAGQLAIESQNDNPFRPSHAGEKRLLDSLEALLNEAEDAEPTVRVNGPERKPTHTYMVNVDYDDLGFARSWDTRTCTCDTPWKH